MTKFNLEKFKKHQKLVSDSIKDNRKIYDEKYNDTYEPIFDGYGIHDSLISWALNHIPTKKLKEYIEQNKFNEEDE